MRGGNDLRVSNNHNVNIPQYVYRKDSDKEKNSMEFSKEDAVSLEISYEGRHAIQIQEKKDFVQDIVSYDRSASDLPEYSGMFEADKAISSAIENCNKEEKGFVYDIIRQNFLIGNSNDMSEDERQANISLGIKKAQYAAENFIEESQRADFLQAMNDIADLASSGKSNQQGQMDYGINKPSYLGHGSGLVYTTNAEDMMKKTDSKAYGEYEKIQSDNANGDVAFNKLKYLTNWYAKKVSTDQNAVKEYEQKADEYIKENVKKRETDDTFQVLNTSSKSRFLESIIEFQKKNPNSFSALIRRELSNPFYYK